MAKNSENSETRVSKSVKKDEKKINTKSKKEKIEKIPSSKKEKKVVTQKKNSNKKSLCNKNLGSKTKNKKHQLKKKQPKPEEEDELDIEDTVEDEVETGDDGFENEDAIENEQNDDADEDVDDVDDDDEDDDDDDNDDEDNDENDDENNDDEDRDVNDDDDDNDDDVTSDKEDGDESELDENDPLFDMKIKVGHSIKKKQPISKKQKAVKSKSNKKSDEDENTPDLDTKKKKNSANRKRPQSAIQNTAKTNSKVKVLNPIFEGWEANNQMQTRDIDFSQWQMSHPARETFFLGPDNYIYHNASSMKKFVDAIQKKQVNEKAISIPMSPMSKVVSTNPRLTVGVTGSRYISHDGEGYRVQPIFYLGKEYVSCIHFYLFNFLYKISYLLLQMNANNQSTLSVKQLRLQVPIANLEPLSKTLNELVEMYPIPQQKENADKQE